MRVEIKKRYAGNRTAQPVEVGIYQYGADELFGLEVFLRDHGNARFLADEVAEVEPVVKVADPIPVKAEVEIEAEKEADEDVHGISSTRKRGRKKS